MINLNSNTTDDQEKFDRLYEEFFAYSYQIAINILGGGKHIEDVMQETWVNIWHSMEVITDNTTAKAWIAVLTRNAAINALNKNIVRDKRTLDIDDVVLYATTPDDNDPLDIVADRDNIEYIYRQMQTLDKKYADVLLLKHKFKCSPEKIAKLLQTNIKTVYTRISRGEKMLKEKLLRHERGEK